MLSVLEADNVVIKNVDVKIKLREIINNFFNFIYVTILKFVDIFIALSLTNIVLNLFIIFHLYDKKQWINQTFFALTEFFLCCYVVEYEMLRNI